MQRLITFLAIILFTLPANAQSWKIIDSINGANYINIHFWDARHGIVSGELHGGFLKTNNGGATWDTIRPPLFSTFYQYPSDMQFVDDHIGFVCGGSGFSTVQTMLIGTKDGGNTWDSLVYNVGGGVIEFGGLNFKYEDAALHGVVYSYASLFRSLDSGKTLQRIPIPDSPLYVADVIMGNNKLIFSGLKYPSGPARIYTSTNWGASWTTVYTDTIAAVAMATKGNTVIAAEGYGYILRSTNGGNTWTKSKIAADSESFRRVKFEANGDVYILGELNIYGSDDDGVTWHKSPQVDTPYFWLWDMSMPSRDTGYIISNRRIYKTTSGGGMLLQVQNISPAYDAIKVYPNPAVMQVQITAPSMVKLNAVVIYDIAGNQVRRIQQGLQQIDVSDLAKGVYLLRIETDSYTVIKKLLVR